MRRTASPCPMVVIAVVCGACSSSGGGSGNPDDVVGPFPNAQHRYAMDRISVPQSMDEAMQLGDDLDGDHAVDNSVGLASSTLVALTDATKNAQDMIDSGALASSLVLATDSLDDAAIAGASFLGADGDNAGAVGGRIVAGGFTSNRTATTRAPGTAIVRLPIFENADPLVLPVAGVEIDLAPDGAGGYTATIRGVVRTEAARAAGYLGLVQMFEADPVKHSTFERGMDTDADGVLTQAEFDGDPLIAAFLSPDVQMFDGDAYQPTPGGTPDSLSIGFAAHFVPCETGTCGTSAPSDACHDRAVDGDESDVDCGGSCAACAAGASCGVDGDCQSTHCDAGTCRAPSCSDGVRDGYESDVDCGANCAACSAGLGCYVDADCASGTCTGSGRGTCM